MALYPYRSNHHHSRVKSTHQNPWSRWCREIGIPALDSDADAVLKNATMKPLREAHRFTHEEAIKLVEKSYPAYLNRTNSQGTPKVSRPTPSTLPFQIFNTIDEALFAGILKGNVCLKWASLPSGPAGRTTRAGRDACPRIMVELSTDIQHRGTYEHTIQILLHQMIHAFLLQCCGHKNRGVSGSGHDLAHNYEYSAIALIIQDFLKVPKTQSCPAYFGCFGINLRHSSRAVSESAGKEAGSTTCRDHGHGLSWEQVRPFCEYVKCATVVPKLSLCDQIPLDAQNIPRPISQYFHLLDSQTGKMMPHLRSTYGDGTYLELHFQNRAFPIARTQVASLSSILSRTSSDPIIKISGGDEETFRRLYDFIDTGCYQPAIKDRQYQDMTTDHRGPPHLLDYDPNCRPYIVADIKMYRLAITMDFPELKRVALKRLEAQSWTNEDPIAALEYIYHGDPIEMSQPKSSSTSAKDLEAKDSSNKIELKRPDDAIRTWVKKWLKVKSCQQSYTHNLEILQKHPQWKDNYVKLRERGSELITDIDIAEMELARERSECQKLRFLDRSQTRSDDDLQNLYGRFIYKRSPLSDEDFANRTHFVDGYAHPYPRPHYCPRGSHDDSQVLPDFPEMVYVPPDRLAEELRGFPYRRTDGAY